MSGDITGIFKSKRIDVCMEEKTMVNLPLAAVKRVMVQAGAERISDAAVKQMTAIAEQYITETTQGALKLTNAAKRKTLAETDITDSMA